jgi:hypothetical protein
MKKDNDLDFAEIDLEREKRTGFPEVIYGETKTPGQSAKIAKKIYDKSDIFLITRTNSKTYNQVKKLIPEANFDRSAKLIWATRKQKAKTNGYVSVVCAGTSDIPIAKEVEITAKLMGCKVLVIKNQINKIRETDCVVAIAGMEGALPTVIAGLIDKPVIAVPTSIGFGTGAKGYSALLTMLNSCAPGISVVNIDAGFSAGFQAGLIARR